MRKKGTYVAIATVRFKAKNTNSASIMRWKPSTITARLFFVCPKYDEQKVRWAAEEKAEAWAKEMESGNEGLMVVYSLKIEAIRTNGIYIMDENCNILCQ